MFRRYCWAIAAVVVAFFLKGSAVGSEAVRVGYLQNDIHQLACWVALEKGFYKKNGVDVRIAGIFKAGPEEMSAFAGGALDMGYVGEAPATTAVANGMVRVKVLAQVNTEGSAVVVAKDATMSTMLDLRGKTVAVPGYSTVQDFLLQKAVAKWGLKQKDVRIMVLKPPEMIGALRTGQIDAFIAWEPYPAKAQTMGVGKALFYSRDIWKNHPCCALVVSEPFLHKRRKDAVAVVRAHIQATDFINENPEEAITIGVKYTGMDERTVRLALKSVNYTYHLSVEGEREYVKFLTSLKYIKVNDPDIFIKNFIDQTILREALEK